MFFVGLGVLFALGCWQLARGLEKAALEKALTARTSRSLSLDNSPANWRSVEYHSATLQGRWRTDRTFLLQNRLYNGQSGVEVLSPFELEGDGSVVLVNRGWVAKPAIDQYPVVPHPTNAEAVEGQIAMPQLGFTLGESYQSSVIWPLPILYYDFDALSEALGETIEPATLVLSSSNPHSFQRIWMPANMPPSKHYGYAAQWWGLTLTLLIFGVVWRRSGRRNRDLNKPRQS